jgi:hypothetical protein
VPLEQPVADEAADDLDDGAADAPEFLEFARPGVQRRLFDDLRRGLIPPEATLDLHGMRVAEARLALARFLAQSLLRQRRCVRLIHGKGFGTAGQPPVLKRRVNHWLPQRPDAGDRRAEQRLVTEAVVVALVAHRDDRRPCPVAHPAPRRYGRRDIFQYISLAMRRTNSPPPRRWSYLADRARA